MLVEGVGFDIERRTLWAVGLGNDGYGIGEGGVVKFFGYTGELQNAGGFEVSFGVFFEQAVNDGYEFGTIIIFSE